MRLRLAYIANVKNYLYSYQNDVCQLSFYVNVPVKLNTCSREKNFTVQKLFLSLSLSLEMTLINHISNNYFHKTIEPDH